MDSYTMNTENSTLHFKENSCIEITGVDGLRGLLAMISSSWAQGYPLIMEAKEVKFIPENNKPQNIYYEVLPVVKDGNKGGIK